MIVPLTPAARAAGCPASLTLTAEGRAAFAPAALPAAGDATAATDTGRSPAGTLLSRGSRTAAARPDTTWPNAAAVPVSRTTALPGAGQSAGRGRSLLAGRPAGSRTPAGRRAALRVIECPGTDLAAGSRDGDQTWPVTGCRGGLPAAASETVSASAPTAATQGRACRVSRDDVESPPECHQPIENPLPARPGPRVCGPGRIRLRQRKHRALAAGWHRAGAPGQVQT